MGQCLCRGRKSSSTPNAAKRSVVRSREVNSGNMDSKSVSQDEVKIRERAKAAVMGAFVADAATMGLHWYGTCVFVCVQNLSVARGFGLGRLCLQ